MPKAEQKDQTIATLVAELRERLTELPDGMQRAMALSKLDDVRDWAQKAARARQT